MLSQNVVFTRTARCVKILGKGVVKVVHRCDAAKENQQLGQCRDDINIIKKYWHIGLRVLHLSTITNRYNLSIKTNWMRLDIISHILHMNTTRVIDHVWRREKERGREEDEN